MEFERLTSADPLSRFGQPYDIYKRNNSNQKTRGFEINPLLLGVLHKKQFSGEEENPDPYEHIACFKDICGTFQLMGYTTDEVRLKLFSQTLTSTALSWYRSLPLEATTTWDNLACEFLARYYPLSKSSGVRRLIMTWKNRPNEGLVRAYIRFKDLLNQCPHHNLPEWYLLHIFYGGLIESNKLELDSCARGAFMSLPITKAWGLLNRIREHKVAWNFGLGSEGGIEIDYDCIHDYDKKGKIGRAHV